MKNPSIVELQNPEKFELIAELSHNNIKTFILEQISFGGKIVRWYMIYQFIMITVGMFFLTRSIVLAIKGNVSPLYFSVSSLIFCFSVLIIIHELMHGIAIKYTGAKKVNYGAYLKKFIFYAEADKHVLNKKQFTIIALAPLVGIQLITLIAALFFLQHPLLYFIMIIMTAHSLFCAGDIALLSIFYRNKNDDIYTFDVKDEKKSYYFKTIK